MKIFRTIFYPLVVCILFISCDDNDDNYEGTTNKPNVTPSTAENIFVRDTVPMLLEIADRLHRQAENPNFFPMPQNYNEAVSKSYDIDELKNGNTRIWMSSDTLKETLGDFTIKAYKKGEIAYNSAKVHTSGLSCGIPTNYMYYDFVFLHTSKRDIKNYAELMLQLRRYIGQSGTSSFLYNEEFSKKYNLGTILWSMSGNCNYLYLDGTPVKE